MFFSKTVGQKKTWPTAGPNDDLSTIQTCLVPLSKSIEIHDEAKVLITKKICKTATCEFSHQGEVSVLSYLSQKSAKTKYRFAWSFESNLIGHIPWSMQMPTQYGIPAISSLVTVYQYILSINFLWNPHRIASFLAKDREAWSPWPASCSFPVGIVSDLYAQALWNRFPCSIL